MRQAVVGEPLVSADIRGIVCYFGCQASKSDKGLAQAAKPEQAVATARAIRIHLDIDLTVAPSLSGQQTLWLGPMTQSRTPQMC